jgi:geranylgeranyl pyrophosphate synthase
MDYAVFPPGKLFRPRLVEAVALDLGGMNDDHYHLASAIELHHAYTLVHDDLPAMDNDLVRRGKPSTHVAHGEWKAVLAGDALLIASFNELNRIQGPEFRRVLRLFSWATGARGLILGQYLDLGNQGKGTLTEIVRIHELKTARLIQVGTLGAYLLAGEKITLRKSIDFLRLGREIGVAFQLLDDLSELTEKEVTAHEREINPFLTVPDEALKALDGSIIRLKSLLLSHKLTHLEAMLRDYFKKGQENLLANYALLEKNVGKTDRLKAWVTTFV